MSSSSPSRSQASSSAPAPSPSVPSASRRILSRFASPLFSQKGRSIADFHIKAQDPHKQYSPGESVKGCVVVKVVKPVRVTHVSVCLHGFVQVFRTPGATADQLRGNTNRIGRAQGRGKKSGEYFGNGFASLFEDESVLCGDGRLDEGVYCFDFEVQFPDDMDLPSSIDFERGTISYMLTATLTRPTTITPITTHEQKIYLVERVDIAPLLAPKPRTITLEPVSRKIKTNKASVSLSTRTPNNPSHEPRPPTPSLSELSLDSRVSSSPSDSPHKVITATVELLKGACLRGDSFPIRISINHTKHIKSINGIIITLYRQARVDMHPALPLGPVSDGQKRKYEDYYPKSITGLGGLSLSGAGSSHTFRKDLAQILVPLYVDPISLTAEINAKIGVPHGAFPTINTVPGAMISFRYYIEVVLDIQGKLTHDRYLSQHGSGPVSAAARPVDAKENNLFSGPDDTPFLMLNGAGILDTAPIRRDKSVATCTFEVVVGTTDSDRKARKGKERATEPPPSPPSAEQTLNTPQRASNHQGHSAVSSRDFESYQHADMYNYDYGHDEYQYGSSYDYGSDGHQYGSGYDYASRGLQWDTDQEYMYDQSYYPDYYEPPTLENEDSLPEKERLRRAEARLMPSQPPAMASASLDAEQATAPALPPDDSYQYSEFAAGSSTQYTGEAMQTTQQPHASEAKHDLIKGSSDNQPPTDDKHELQRRQLELAASGPPSSSVNTAEEEISTESGPSAPLIIDNDMHEYVLDRLDLARYHDAFVDEGFDSWDTLMDVTESDLEALNVKLGHRRKLQRAILNASKDRTPLPLLLHSASRDESAGLDEPKKTQTPHFRQQNSIESQEQDAAARNNGPSQRSKRKYRRHPKADEHAPERPPSAYVIFSNQIRDQLKGKDLSFTEIAKLVGERWQELGPNEKEPCEREAQALKDKYYSELRQYKKTPQYKQYQDYLIEFKAKHSGEGASQAQGPGQGQGPDSKKIKLRSASGQSRSYEEATVDGDEGAEGMDGGEGVDELEGDDGSVDVGDNTHNQPPSPSDRVQHSSTYSSPNTETYRLFPIPKAPSDAGTASSYSTWRSVPPAYPTTAATTLSRHTTNNSALRSEHGSTSPATSLPPTSTHSSASNKPPTILPPLNQLSSIASRKPNDTPLINWPLHTTLPPLDPRAMSQRATPNPLYSPTNHHTTQSAPSHHSPPSLSAKDSYDVGSQNKASLSTLLRATEHVERDGPHSAASSNHKTSR
ncbi:HMG-box, partial [Aureobasidium melanogenum]